MIFLPLDKMRDLTIKRNRKIYLRLYKDHFLNDLDSPPKRLVETKFAARFHGVLQIKHLAINQIYDR